MFARQIWQFMWQLQLDMYSSLNSGSNLGRKASSTLPIPIPSLNLVNIPPIVELSTCQVEAGQNNPKIFDKGPNLKNSGLYLGLAQQSTFQIFFSDSVHRWKHLACAGSSRFRRWSDSDPARSKNNLMRNHITPGPHQRWLRHHVGAPSSGYLCGSLNQGLINYDWGS